MRTLAACAALALLSAAPPPRPRPALKSFSAKERASLVKKRVSADYEYLEALYKHFHQRPELSFQESRTSARLAKELRAAGAEVTERVGGYGVVGVLRNGPGPVVLVRADMDALPIAEKTGLPYASTEKARNKNGVEVGVMHACGHDIHMTCLVGTARALVALKDRWKGTVLLIGQPAEEVGQGAKRMLADRLYERFGTPDWALALHCDSQRPHGTVACREGPALANVDSVDVVLRGKGGHGVYPHTTIDPVVMAAHFILELQSLVSRENNPTQPAVITVGSIHAGTKHNIVPDEVRMQLTVRSTLDPVRHRLLEGIKRKAFAVAKGANAPDPEVKIDLAEYTPALSNDPALTRKMTALFREALGEEAVSERPLVMGGEDFSRFAAGGVPIVIWHIGTVAPERVAESKRPGGKPLPSLHSDMYNPAVEPTIKTGVLTMTLAVLRLLGK